MAYSKSKASGDSNNGRGGSAGGTNWRNVVSQEKASGGIVSLQTVRGLIQESRAGQSTEEFYELELAEVIDVLLDEDELPELEDGSGKNWEALGAVLARGINSEKHKSVDGISLAFPLNPNENNYPLRGENVVIVDYMDKRFYTTLVNFFNSPNNNLQPGLSGARSIESMEEDGIFEYFEPDKEIRKMYPYQGDNIYQGRWGNSIRFGSNIIPGSHEDDNDKPDSPNILIRAGQLIHADKFNKGGVVQKLKDSPKKPVKEDINADGSSIWLTTDQSVKLNKDSPEYGHPSNSRKHKLMTEVHNDKNPVDGGPQIVINTDRLTFNTKRREILGYSAGGIGWGTTWSFTIDADKQFCVATPRIRFYTGEFNMLIGPNAIDQVVGGGSPESGDPAPFPSIEDIMQNPGVSGLNISDKVYLSSDCPSFLKLDNEAHLQSCDGAIVHLDDCAGIKDNQGSFLRIGGKALGITGYVKDRDDMGQQHLVYGEALTDILDELITSILNITAIPTGAGPSGPVSATPSLADFESIRAKLCDLLMKPEE